MRTVSQVAPGKPQILHHPDMSEAARLRIHGSGQHTEIGQLTVSEPTTVEFEWTIGELTVVDGGELLVVWRWPFDWSDLQTSDPHAPGYMHAEAISGDGVGAPITLNLRYNWIAGIEPWHHQIRVRVESGQLVNGDRVRLTCGASPAGSEPTAGPGTWRAPTCVADRCRFLMLIDAHGDGTRQRLVDQPSFRVVPGPPERLAAVVPSDAVVGEPVTLIVRAEDAWGNPTQLDAACAVSTQNSAAGTIKASPVERDTVRPAQHFDVTFDTPGVVILNATGSGFSAESNPVTVHESAPIEQLFWGDLHSGQTEIGCGCGSVGESYAFGRDCAGIQFITHQANDHYVTLDEWNETRRDTDEHYEPGRYVPILGCEWSPLTKDGGDRNVFYGDDDPVLRRSDRFFLEDDPDPEPDIRTAPEFHDAFRDRNVLVNIHVGGRMTNLEWYEQAIEKLCETHSTHGTVEWFFMDALSRGYRVGLTAGTDGVMGRPGADHPGRRLIRNLRNGLTAVYAKELTRESLWEALQNRRCYATTGERIRLEFEVNGLPMGSEIQSAGPPQIRFKVEGTRPIERVDLFRGVDIIESWQVTPRVEWNTADSANGRLVRVLWGGTERKGTARLQRVNWDGSLTAHDGTIELVSAINFQSIADEVHQVSPDQIAWKSQTAGNAAGCLIRVSGDDCELAFDAGPKQFQAAVAQFSTEMRLDAGGVNRFISVGPAPRSDGPQLFEHATSDPEHLAGTQPYWIRVVQTDQSMAWSSPVYVTT